MNRLLDGNQMHISKAILQKWLNESIDIPGNSSLYLHYDFKTKCFGLHFHWTKENDPCSYGEDFVEFSKLDSKEVLEDIVGSK